MEVDKHERGSTGRARKRIWEAWKRHRARTDWQERVESRKEGRQRAATGEEESSSERTEAWQGRQDTQHTRGELRGDRKGGTQERGPEGWTIAATLIVYMKGEQRKADEEKVRRAKEERGEGRRAAQQGDESPEDEREGTRWETRARETRGAATRAQDRESEGNGTREGSLIEEEGMEAEGRARGLYEGMVRGLKRGCYWRRCRDE